MQQSIFDVIFPKFTFKKPIRLIEMFGGYGSQHLALKYLGVKVEHWKLVEWAVKSIQAYKDIHYTNVDTDYSKDLSKEEIVDYLNSLGISSNYNEPMKFEQIKRLNETQLRNIYNNIKITKNLVNIQNVKGRDLEIVDTGKYDYVLTYSFPCQDLSLAGKRAGMSDNSTRSGMLWEVERILEQCHEIGQMPRVLLMENVTQVIGKDNVEHFNKWQLKLEQLGYKNYHKNLIATDYGIPQTRDRTFMVSILGDYSYTFPEPIPLKLKLKDMLEDNVDEKYYLSDKMLNYMLGNTEKVGKYNRKEVFMRNFDKNKENAATITTCAGNRPTDNFIQIPEATKKGYTEATDGDGVYINRPHQKRDVVQKGKIQTLKTNVDDIGVVIKQNLKSELVENLIKNDMVEEFDVIKHSYTSNKLNDKRLIPNKNISPTLDTRSDCLGVVVKGTYQYAKSDNFMKGKPRFQQNKNTADTLQTTPKEGVALEEQNVLRIRKLSTRECFRLMGVKDEDYERIAKNQSNSSLYHLAGDSIVVNVLMAIFKEMLGAD